MASNSPSTLGTGRPRPLPCPLGRLNTPRSCGVSGTAAPVPSSRNVRCPRHRVRSCSPSPSPPHSAPPPPPPPPPPVVPATTASTLRRRSRCRAARWRRRGSRSRLTAHQGHDLVGRHARLGRAPRCLLPPLRRALRGRVLVGGEQ